MNDTNKTVDKAVDEAMYRAVYRAVDTALGFDAEGAVWKAVHRTVDQSAVIELAVDEAVDEDFPHPALQDYLHEIGGSW